MVIKNRRFKSINAIHIVAMTAFLFSCQSEKRINLPFQESDIKSIEIVNYNTNDSVIVDNQMDELLSAIQGLTQIDALEVNDINEPYYFLNVTYGENGYTERIFLAGYREVIVSKIKYRTQSYGQLFGFMDQVYQKHLIENKEKEIPTSMDYYVTVPQGYNWLDLQNSGMTSFSGTAYCNYASIFSSQFHEVLDYCSLTPELVREDIEKYADIIDALPGTRNLLEQLYVKLVNHKPYEVNVYRDLLYQEEMK